MNSRIKSSQIIFDIIIVISFDRLTHLLTGQMIHTIPRKTLGFATDREKIDAGSHPQVQFKVKFNFIR